MGYKTYPSLNYNKKCDVVVVGGGLSGCLALYYLSHYNIDTILVEKNSIASGNSILSPGFMENKTDLEMYKLLKFLPKEKAQRAYILCKKAIDDLDNILYNWGYQHLMKRKIVDYIYNNSNKNYSNECGFIDPFKLCHMLLKTSLEKNAKVYENTTITGYDSYCNNLKIKTNNSNYIECKKIVFTDVFSCYRLIKEWDILEPAKVHSIVTNQMDCSLYNSVKKYLIEKKANAIYTYIRPTKDKRIIISEFNGNSHSDIQSYLINKLKNLLCLSPTKDLKSEYYFSKTFGESQDGLPYIGTHPKFDNCYFNLPLGRNHICYSLIGAQIIKDLILYENNPDAELFNFERN